MGGAEVHALHQMQYFSLLFFFAEPIASHSTTETHVIVITFHSPSCLGQEIAKAPFGFRVKLSAFHLSTTRDGGFTSTREAVNTNFIWFNVAGI